LIRYFTPDSFDFSEFVAFRRENLFWLSEYLQQFSQSDRADCWQHVERDTGFRRVHL